MKDGVAFWHELDWQDQFGNSSKMIDAIINSSRAYIVFITPDFRVGFCNRKAWQSSKILFGLDLRIGSNFLEYLNQMHEEISLTFKENFTKVILEGGTLTTDREMRYHDVKGWIRTEYTPVYNEQELIGVSLRVVDITERKERELQIELQNDKLSEIAWIQSHETRQPLASALGLLHILDRQSLTHENQKIVALLEETIQKLDVVIRDTVVKANTMCQHKSKI
jgi:signal transduction histidine kinase